MSAIRKTRVHRAAGFVSGALCLVVLAGCGEEDFKNRPRPAVALEVTGVIQRDKVTVSPDSFGSGPVLLTISNQTKESHTVSLCEESAPCEEPQLREQVGPINPLDTATIQADLETGTYEVQAGSDQEIEPGKLDVGESRGDSNDELLLP